ncbi:hypothetical protein Snas_5623 [Stackebrandtia nassauensis DSM 44728]|uniref:Uncharacterized protein n=1 Tax=Stackebrandtia nassauensis (strain DSM 44728 / CIP 108903 / NRRL B-16338 / NBRC 102104 / LLR-40K-21) TaxID=446470 RepID=D3PX29_STANL|nr:hypothetical protein Snas_5623 [Stackebrandtia nassauensis DSM 44728]
MGFSLKVVPGTVSSPQLLDNRLLRHDKLRQRPKPQRPNN